MIGHSTSRRSYDTVAARYEQAISDELAVKPLDRALLAALAEQCAGGVVGDLGCGPGHVAAHLSAPGTNVAGVDLSPAWARWPAGWALIAFHPADADARPGDTRHLVIWGDQPVDLTFRFLDPDAETTAAGYAGLRLTARLDRQPVDGERPSTRSYLLLQAQ